MAEMWRMLGFRLDAAKTARFFASTAHNCDNVAFPGPRLDAMYGAAEIQHRPISGDGLGAYGITGLVRHSVVSAKGHIIKRISRINFH